MSPMPTRRERFKRWSRRALVRIRRTLPPGTRIPVGLLLMLGGVLGFLPIVGFWMLPLGLAVAALDVAPMIRRLRGR